MSEESKMDTDYVHMVDGSGAKRSGPSINLDDPNLSQEDRDMRLAIALQQQENAAAYDEHKKKHDAAVAANVNRTSRSNTHTRLAAVRDKDHGMLSVPAVYQNEHAYKSGEKYEAPGGMSAASLKGAMPQEVADHNLAVELQKVENVGAGTGQQMSKMVKEEKDEVEAQEHRTNRSQVKRF